MLKLAILGLDGLYPGFIHTFRDALPNLNRALKAGASTHLLSTVPPYTPQAWTTLSTGVNPGVHGISGFIRQTEEPDSRPELLRRTSIQVPQMWDYLENEQIRTGILNVPMTFPAPRKSTFAVSGMLTPSVTTPGFIWPPSLHRKLLSQIPGYVIDTAVKKKDVHRAAIWPKLGTMLKSRIQAARYLLATETVDVFFCVLVVLDRIYHLYFRFLDPSDNLFETGKAEKVRSRLTPFLQEIDRFAGELLEQADTVLLVSDHGFRAEEGKFYTNNYLASEGYADVKRSLTGKSVDFFTSLLGRERIRRLLPGFLFEKKLNSTETFVQGDSRARASPLAAQGIFCRDKEIVADLADKLQMLRDPRDGAPLVSDLYLRKDVYTGDHAGGFPDIVLSLKNGGIEASPHVIGKKFLSLSSADWPGGHHDSKGVFAACGSNAEEAALSKTKNNTMPAEISDVLPFVLNLLTVKASVPQVQHKPAQPEGGAS